MNHKQFWSLSFFEASLNLLAMLAMLVSRCLANDLHSLGNMGGSITHAVTFNQKGKNLQSRFSPRMLSCFDFFLRVNIISSQFCYLLRYG